MNAQVKKPDFIPTARILDCTEEEYFADPCEVPSLSQSIAGVMLSRSPLHGWSAHPRLGGAPSANDEEEDEEEETTPALDDGKLLHKLMLGKGVDVVIVHADNFKTKLARQQRDEARDAGKLPIIAHKFDAFVKTAEVLRDRCAQAGYPLTGESEVAIEWTEPGANGPVLCRCRMDHVFMSDGVILDIKKVRNAHPRKVAATFVDYGYDLQAHVYPRALQALRPELTGRVKFKFLFMELTPPYCVVPADLDGAFREIGTLRWQTAVRLWERCLATGHWPSYADGSITLEAPVYVIQRELGNDFHE
jgi:PDDEXK-like uncharacterized protein DUF3799